jgi:hypothetical protein
MDGYDKIKATEVARGTLKSGQGRADRGCSRSRSRPPATGATLTLAWGEQSWSTGITAAK